MAFDNRRTLQLLHRVVLPLDRILQRADRATGCSAAQLSALSAVIYFKATTLSVLAAHERISVPTASRIVESLVRDGLVRRETDRGDRRAVTLSATAKGIGAVETACAARAAALAEALEGLSSADWQAVGGAARAFNRLFGYAGTQDG